MGGTNSSLATGARAMASLLMARRSNGILSNGGFASRTGEASVQTLGWRRRGLGTRLRWISLSLSHSLSHWAQDLPRNENTLHPHQYIQMEWKVHWIKWQCEERARLTGFQFGSTSSAHGECWWWDNFQSSYRPWFIAPPEVQKGSLLSWFPHLPFSRGTLRGS